MSCPKKIRIRFIAWLIGVALFLQMQVQADPPRSSLDAILASTAKIHGVTTERYLALDHLRRGLGEECDQESRSPEGSAHLRALVNKALSDIDVAAQPVTGEGSSLPASFTALYFPAQRPDDPPFIVLSKLGFMGLKDENLEDQWTL